MNDLLKDILLEFHLPLGNPVLIFALILFIILLAPIIIRRLNIPGIIGLIISGVIVGPHGLNLLEKNSAIDLFSTIGLLYIMFIAGLELDMNEFKRNKHKSIIFGILTFVIPISIGFPICRYILNYELTASLLIASMFATHTLVAYPIVSKLGVSKNQAVAITVGGTILTDTAVLIVLAVIMGSSQGILNNEFWIRLAILFAIFTLIMFWVIPKITRWFFKKLESEKHAHYILVLSVVFLSAFLAEIAGLEPLIGAFMAGLALNPLIPHSSALMNRIEFIGNSLFIPFFLISVGMLVDVSVIFSGPMAIIIAVVLTLGALLGKWLAAFFTQLIFKYSKAQRQLIFGLSSAHAAAILAVVLVGFKGGILDENILNGTIVLILITCIIASMATERAAKKMLIAQKRLESAVPEINMPYTEHILLPIANLLNYQKLLDLTLLFKDKSSNLPITVLSVVPNNSEAEMNIIAAKAKLEEFKKQGAESEIIVNTMATIDYNPASAIARISREVMADIIILGWPEKVGILENLIGERMNSIINKIDKNIFICSVQKQLIHQKRIVVFTPPLAEKENGFETWLKKVSLLSNELSIPIIHFGSKSTHDAIEYNIAHKKIAKSFDFNEFEQWEDILVLSRKINDDDLIVLVSARKRSVSYMNYLDLIPGKLERHFSKNNKIVVYPQQFDRSYGKNEDLNSNPLAKGIQAIGSMGNRIGNIFKEN